MPRLLDTTSPDFDADFAAFLGERRDAGADVCDAVRRILRDVRVRGDAALIEATTRYDGVELTADELRVPDAEREAAYRACTDDQIAALTLAAERIEACHRCQLPEDGRHVDSAGVELGHRWTPLDSVGLYVPGGTAAYPSSVLMNAVPARTVGVKRVAMTVPAPQGRLSPLVLAAAKIAGVDEIYRVGGAQAIAALAFGTETIAPVDKILGPGNAYVAEAKRQVFGTVGIDMVAGPSEILVIADAGNDPDWIAADLLSQAEHDEAAQAVLITDDRAFAEVVTAAAEDHLSALPRASIARKSWEAHGAVIVAANLDQAPALADRIAPEHLEIATADPERLLKRIHHAGAIFLGRHTPEAVGDYVAGSNHVLPTAGTARFSSGLNVFDFMKRTSIVRCTPESLGAIGPAAITLAEAEGLDAHARSIAIRLNARRTVR